MQVVVVIADADADAAAAADTVLIMDTELLLLSGYGLTTINHKY